LPTGTFRWPLSIRYISGADVLKPSFHPGNGNRIALSTIAGRTIVDATLASARMICSPSDFV